MPLKPTVTEGDLNKAARLDGVLPDGFALGGSDNRGLLPDGKVLPEGLGAQLNSGVKLKQQP
jgi:hypothetical protein